MNVIDAVKKACMEPTLLDSLSWICIWESERIVRQAKMNKVVNIETGARWETCFKHCLGLVIDQYKKDLE